MGNIEIFAYASSSAGNLYTVSDGKTVLMLECGLPMAAIRKALGFRVSRVAGCLISHDHTDHAMAAKDLMRAGVDIYASRGSIEALGLSGHRLRPVRAHQTFTVGTWTVLPFDTVHDAAEPLGFLLASRSVGKLLYLTDTAYCKYRFHGLTHVMVEANYALDILRTNVANGTVPQSLYDRVVKSHFSLDHVKEFLAANDLSRVEEIWLLHLSDSNSDGERFKREIQELTGKAVIVADQHQAITSLP